MAVRSEFEEDDELSELEDLDELELDELELSVRRFSVVTVLVSLLDDSACLYPLPFTTFPCSSPGCGLGEATTTTNGRPPGYQPYPEKDA